MEKIKKYFYEKTGMYIDWDQLKNLPNVNTIIDIGVGKNGTENLYKRFSSSKLILIDPLIEAKNYANKNLKHRDYEFFQYAVGEENFESTIKVEKNIMRVNLLMKG